MTKARDYLEQISWMKSELAALAAQREALMTQVAGVGAIRYDKDKVQTSPDNTFESSIIRALEKRKPIDSRIDYLRREIKKRTGQIRTMGGKTGAVLYCRYVDGLTWRTICHRMGIKYRAAIILHNRGLIRFEQRFLREM